MRAFLTVAAVVAVAVSAADVGFSQAKPSGTKPHPIEGVWKATSRVATGANAAANPNRQPSVFIFTNGYYGQVTQDAATPLPPRPVLAPPKDPNNLTIAEKLARYEHWEPFGAAAGRYEVKGTRLYQYALVAKSQSAAIVARNAGKETSTSAGFEIESAGTDTLVLTNRSADGKTEGRFTYTRLDKPEAAGAKPHPIEGVWKATSTLRTGANAGGNPNRQPGIFIYKNGYFTIVRQDAGFPLPPRPVLALPKDPNNLTDAEKLARYEHWAPFAGDAGRYEVKGTTLYQYGLVNKDQNADAIARNKTGNLGTVNPNSELEFSNGNNTMVQITRSADGKTVTRRTYTRLE